MNNFDIWWVYKQRRDRRRFVDVLNEYPAFFQTSLHAHFVALIVALYRLYEPKTDTFNLTHFMKRLETEATIPRRKLADLRRRIRTVMPIWRKVSIIRNNAFGHRSTGLTVQEAFKRAAITPNQLRAQIKKTTKILNAISLELDGSTHAFNLRGTEDTRRVLSALKRIRSSRSNPSLKPPRRRQSAAQLTREAN
jgi:AbiU2